MPVPLLPPEVVLVVLDELSLADIIAAGHVSRAWRIAARSHPKFARDILLSTIRAFDGSRGILSDSAVHFFLDRLAALPGGALNLNIYVCAIDNDACGASANRVRTMVVPALRECLPRLAALTLQCDCDLIPDILGALCAGAVPQLTTFKFLATDRNGKTAFLKPELPLDLFAGRAPLLCTLHMDGCQLPAHGVPAFSAVRALTRSADRATWDGGLCDLQPARFFANCPALAELAIDCRFCPLSAECWDTCPLQAVANLRRLTVARSYEPEDTDVVVRALAHTAMEDIDVPVLSVDPDITSLLFRHLDDSATLELHIVEEMVTDDSRGEPTVIIRCSVYDAARNRRRTFTHDHALPSYIDFASVRRALNPWCSRAAHRFTSMLLPGTSGAWLYLSNLFHGADLLNLQRLTFTLSKSLFGDSRIYADEVLALPALTTVELTAEGTDMVEVGVHDVNYLVHDVFPIFEGRMLVLELVNVSLIGDIKDLSRVFSFANRIALLGSS